MLVNMYIRSAVAYGLTPGSKLGPTTPTSRLYTTSALGSCGLGCRFLTKFQLA